MTKFVLIFSTWHGPKKNQKMRTKCHEIQARNISHAKNEALMMIKASSRHWKNGTELGSSVLVGRREGKPRDRHGDFIFFGRDKFSFSSQISSASSTKFWRKYGYI